MGNILIQIASWGVTGYLAFNFYLTGQHVYSLWKPPSCDSSDARNCFCGSFTEETMMYFEVYLSRTSKFHKDFQSSSRFQRVYSSAAPPASDDNEDDQFSSWHPVNVSFDAEPIHHKAFINGKSNFYKLHRNKSLIYAHIIAYKPPVPTDKRTQSLYHTMSIPTDSIFSVNVVPITYYHSPPANTFNLKDGTSGKKDYDTLSTQEQGDRMLYDKVMYFVPNLTIHYVVDFNCYDLKEIPGDIFHHLRASQRKKQGYDPIIYHSELHQMHKYALPLMDANGDLLSNTNHTDYDYDLKNLTLEIKFEPISLGMFRLYLMMDNNNRAMQQQWEFTPQDSDQIKGLFVDTPPLLTLATFVAAMLHSLFGVLAMKSDVSFWYTKDGAESLKGLSTNAVTFESISSIVITIYLIDSNQTNKLVIAFQIAECLLGLWKVQRIRNLKKQIEFKQSVADYEISDDEDSSDSDSDSDSDDSSSAEEEVKEKMKKPKTKKGAMQLRKEKKKKKEKNTKRKEEEKDTKEEEKKEEKVTEETEGLDQKATRWMIMVMIPITLGYGVYSFFYHKHKSILSFIINVSASCVYGLGFIHLTPQLFINYELKSVDSLPWKVLIYKFFNTFVDDLFSFVIDMPLMHRLACFRDDIVFFVFLYQWKIYGSKKRKQD